MNPTNPGIIENRFHVQTMLELLHSFCMIHEHCCSIALVSIVPEIKFNYMCIRPSARRHSVCTNCMSKLSCPAFVVVKSSSMLQMHTGRLSAVPLASGYINLHVKATRCVFHSLDFQQK